LTEELNLDAA